FMIRTHPEVFASAGPQKQAEDHEAPWSLGWCLGVLVGSSVLAAFLSEILVGAVEGTGEALGLSSAVLGIVLLASGGGGCSSKSCCSRALVESRKAYPPSPWHARAESTCRSASHLGAASSSRCSSHRGWLLPPILYG